MAGEQNDTENRTDSGLQGELRSSDDVRRGYISGLTFRNEPITYAAVDGNAIFEGDIVLGTVDEVENERDTIEGPPEDEESPVAHGVVIVGNRVRWPDGVVPFRIDDDLPNQQRVTDAIEHWEERTNLRFRQRTDESNFVEFAEGGGCSSNVGMIGGRQQISLADGCTTGSTIHEIGHAIGLWHEQSREDRDIHISINWENIQTNRRHNFDQHISDGDDVGPYDYDSIMHYPTWAFAIDSSEPTIFSPQPIGQRNELSDYDIRTANTIYPEKTTLSETSTNGPVLTDRNGNVLLSWTGTDNRLNVLQSNDGQNFTNKTTLDETSLLAPDLTVFQDRYVLAWTGTDNRLNVLQSDDGQNWTDKVTLNDTSKSSPSLAVFGPYLYIAWRGVGNEWLNVMRTTDDQTWEHKQTLTSDTSSSGPSIVRLDDRLLLAWRGTGNNLLNVMRSHNGTSFHGKVTLSETTLSKPNLHVHDDEAYLCWQGVGNKSLNLLPSRDGIDWHGKITSGETCLDGPALGTLDPAGDEERMLWCWTGTDNRLNTGLI
jgi:astacin